MPVFGAKMLEPPVTAGDYIKIIVAIFTMIEITSAKGLCDAWYQIIGGNLLKDVQFRGNTSDISWIAAGTESRIDFRLSLEWHNDYSKEGSPLYLSLQQNLTKFMIGAKQALGYDNFQFTVHSFSPGSVIAHTSFKPKIRNTEDLRQRRDRLRQNNNLRVKRGSAEFGMLYEMRISRYTSGDTNKNPITWAILTCKANVSDNRRTTWSKGGSPIVSDGNRIQIRRIEKENTVTSTLRINPMIYSDAGQYRCTIGNFKSQRKVTMLPKVKLESSVKPKIFEGVRFEMTCTVVVGDGTVRVRFLHDQNLLKQTSTSGNQATHVVEQAGLGTYCCVGVSTGGKLGPKSTKLTVFERYYQSFSVLLVNKVDVIVTYRKMESLSTRDFSHYEIIAETTGEMPLKFFTQAPFGELTIRNLTADKGYTIKMRPITTNSAIVKSTSKTVHTRGHSKIYVLEYALNSTLAQTYDSNNTKLSGLVTWSNRLYNQSSQRFEKLSELILTKVTPIFTNIFGYYLYNIKVDHFRKGILVSIILELSSAMPPQTIPILPVENYLSDSHSSIPGLQWIKLDKIVPPAGQFVSVYFDSRQQRLYSVGEAVTLVCNADVIGDGSGVKFSWTLNHYTIMKSSKLERRIHYNVTTRREQTFKSYITFDPIQSGDSGTLVCLVEGDSFKTTTTHREINIKSVVNVKLSPQSVAAEVGTRATWTCKLLPNGKYVSGGKVEVVWERDGVVLRPVPDAIQMGIKSSVETTLTIYSVKSDAIISCHAENGAGPGARSESYLTVFNKALLTCPAEVSENGLTFPETNLGKTAHVPCPKSKLGLVTRDCVLSVNETALWTNTNRSNCISPQFIELEKVALAVSSGMEESTPRELCKTLVNITDVTASKEALLPKEISASVSILKTLNKIEAQSDSAGKIAPDFMTSASQALDPVNLESWEELSDTEIAGEMLGVVGDHGAMYAQAAQTDEGMKEIVKENLVLQVKRVNSVDNDGKKCKQQIRMPTRTANLPDWVLESNDMLELQWKALKFSGDSKMIGIATVQYRTISNVLPANKNSRGDVFKANSRVLSVRILPDIDYALDPPLKYTVNHLRDNQYSPRCAFWDFEMPNGGSWSTRGCKRVKTASDKNSTTCSCNHMTNFAVLMSTVSVSDALGLHILTTVGCSCSIVCCIVCIIIYIVIDFKLGKLRPVPKSIPKERKTIVINMCAALAAGNLVLMTGLEQTENRVVCATVSIVLHILWLAVFAFLLCQGVDLARKTLNYRNFMKRQPDRSKWYAFGSWGMCILIVGVCFALTQGEGYGNEYYCWLSVENGLIYAFIGPVMGVIIVNSVIVILLIRVVAKSGGTTSPNRSIKDKASQGLRALIPLVPSMGITWVFGILMLDNSSTAFQYIFTLFNSLQGLTLFLVYVLFNSRMIVAIKEVSGIKHPSQTFSSSAGKSQDTMETNIGKSPGSDKLSRRRITPSSSRPTYAKHQDKTDNSCKTRRTFSYLTKTRVLPLLDVSSEEGNVEIDDSVRKIEVEHLSELPRDDSLLEQDESGDRRRDEKSFILKATSDDADGHCNPAFRDSVTENDSCRLRNKRCSQATDDTSRHSYPWLCEDGDPEFLEKMIERRKYLDSVCAVDENTAVENANRSSGDVVEKVGDSNARQRWNLLARVLNTANMRNELLESLRNQQQQTVKSNIHRDTTAFMTVL